MFLLVRQVLREARYAPPMPCRVPPILLAQFSGLYFTDLPLLLAGAAITIIPVLIVYVVFQRYIIEGVQLTGVRK